VRRHGKSEIEVVINRGCIFRCDNCISRVHFNPTRSDFISYSDLQLGFRSYQMTTFDRHRRSGDPLTRPSAQPQTSADDIFLLTYSTHRDPTNDLGFEVLESGGHHLTGERAESKGVDVDPLWGQSGGQVTTQAIRREVRSVRRYDECEKTQLTELEPPWKTSTRRFPFPVQPLH
jgi:hypothetical protein